MVSKCILYHQIVPIRWMIILSFIHWYLYLYSVRFKSNHTERAALLLPVYLFIAMGENVRFKMYCTVIVSQINKYTVYTLTINCLARKPLSNCDCVCSGTSGPRSMPMIVAPVTTNHMWNNVKQYTVIIAWQ